MGKTLSFSITRQNNPKILKKLGDNQVTDGNGDEMFNKVIRFVENSVVVSPVKQSGFLCVFMFPIPSINILSRFE